MKQRDTAYAFAVAKVRALWEKLLSPEDFQHLAKTKDQASRMKFLLEKGYSGDSEEDMTDAELSRVYRLLWDMAPDKELIKILMLPADYHNLKVMLKAEFLGENLDKLLEPGGRISPEKLKRKEFSAWSPLLKEGYQLGKRALKSRQDARKMECILDACCFKEMLTLAEESRNDFVIRLVQCEIDLKNLTSLLRIQKRGEEASDLRRAYLSGGTVSLSLLEEGLEKPFEEVLSRTAYSALAESSSDLVHFAEKAREYVFSFLQGAKQESFGVAPLFAYFYAKKQEVARLRYLLSECRRGKQRENLWERVQKIYA